MSLFVSDLPDKERLLVTIIRSICSTMLLKGFSTSRQDWNSPGIGELVHFDHKLDVREFKPGDLVLCNSSGIHPYTVGFVVEILGYAELLIREIGSDRTCRVGNESFVAIRGLMDRDLWEGDRYKFYRKVWKAFCKTGEDWYRYGGLKFNDDGTATMTVREKFGGCIADQGTESVPFDVVMKWDKKTTIKNIVQALKDGGVGTKKFERRPKQPEES